MRTQIDFSKGARKGSENGPYDKKSAITSHRIMYAPRSPKSHVKTGVGCQCRAAKGHCEQH